jgi:hypothetical protein
MRKLHCLLVGFPLREPFHSLASIRIKSSKTTAGTTADADGAFSLLPIKTGIDSKSQKWQ